MTILRKIALFLGLASAGCDQASLGAPSPAGPAPSASDAAATQIREAEFELSLSKDWKPVPTGDPEQWRYDSDSRRTSIIISVVPARIPKARLLEAADAMAAIWRESQLEARAGRHPQFGDRWVKLTEEGDAGHVAYAAYDDHTIIRFMGWTTEQKILSFSVETETRDNELSKQVFDEAFAGFRFYVP